MQAHPQKIGSKNDQFLPPEVILQGLLSSTDHPCNCGVVETECECEEEQLNEQIRTLQGQSNNIRAQIMEVERLLQVRDQLYSQLDLLREERDQIQNEVECQLSYEQTETVKCSGYKQMNERLKRRIYQVRQYIQKMTFENQKIQQGIISQQYLQQEDEYRRRQYQTQYPVYEGRKQYSNNLQTMISKINDKQEDAWRRVRRQEEDIERRNAEARMRRTEGMTYYSPKARTFYSPNRQIY